MHRIFIGVDRRQWLAYTVLQHSLMSRSSQPLAITPLVLPQLPITRQGLTDFTFSRYLVPWLCGFEGTALFIDADFLCLADVNELFALSDPRYAVQVVKSSYKFEWPSLMLFQCESCKALTPEYINASDSEPQMLGWGEVGALNNEWNFLVGYDNQPSKPKMLHYTQGIPEFLEMQGSQFYQEWHDEKAKALDTCSWIELMGQSIHAKPVLQRIDMKRQLRQSS